MKIIIKANAYTSNPNKRGVSEAPQDGNNSGHENRQGQNQIDTLPKASKG